MNIDETSRGTILLFIEQINEENLSCIVTDIIIGNRGSTVMYCVLVDWDEDG